MKKSEAYRLAIMAVMKDNDIDYDESVDVIVVLVEAMGTAKTLEKLEEEK